MENFSFRSKTVFHPLPVVDPESLPISKLEHFMTIDNDYQPLAIVIKILNRDMSRKDDN